MPHPRPPGDGPRFEINSLLENIMTRSIPVSLLALAALTLASPAWAGEITGNGKAITIKGKSLCAYSGRNDTPEGLVMEVAPGVFVTIDPGGRNQSYGFFFSQFDDFLDSPSNPEARSGFAFPANGCNPTWDGGE